MQKIIPALTKVPDKVQFGVKVKLLNLDTEEVITYRIVGPYEADPANGSISVYSPLARSLIGKEIGDEVQVNTPSGIKNFEILDIEI